MEGTPLHQRQTYSCIHWTDRYHIAATATSTTGRSTPKHFNSKVIYISHNFPALFVEGRRSCAPSSQLWAAGPWTPWLRSLGCWLMFGAGGHTGGKQRRVKTHANPPFDRPVRTVMLAARHTANQRCSPALRWNAPPADGNASPVNPETNVRSRGNTLSAFTSTWAG